MIFLWMNIVMSRLPQLIYKGNFTHPRTKMKLIEKGKKGIATSFSSLDDPKAGMEVVGQIIFWCYTRCEYNNECCYHPPFKPPTKIRDIRRDVLDLLNKLLHNGETAIDASLHYLFWSKEKTYDFIRAVAELREAPNCTLRTKLEKANRSVLGTERVKGEDVVVDCTSKFPNQFFAIVKYGKHGVLVDDGKKDERYKYTSTKVYHLYEIIRNLLSHKNAIRRKVYGTKDQTPYLIEMFNTTKGGLYSFLMERFPNFIKEAFRLLKDVVHEDHRFTKFYK